MRENINYQNQIILTKIDLNNQIKQTKKENELLLKQKEDRIEQMENEFKPQSNSNLTKRCSQRIRSSKFKQPKYDDYFDQDSISDESDTNQNDDSESFFDESITQSDNEEGVLSKKKARKVSTNTRNTTRLRPTRNLANLNSKPSHLRVKIFFSFNK